MSLDVELVRYFCPWCDEPQGKQLYKSAEIEVICIKCRKSIGIQTDENFKPVRVGRLIGIESLIEKQNQHANKNNDSTISIGNVYGSVAFGDNAKLTTNIYNETMRAIDEAQNLDPEKKKQAKGILKYVKTNAAVFLPIIADATKKALGL